MRTTPSPSTGTGRAFSFGASGAGPPLALMTYEEALARLAEEERGEGWLLHCEREGIFQLPTAEWADALARAISPLGAERPVEVGAGRGELGQALRGRGIPLILTDPQGAGAGPGGAGGVEALGVSATLSRHRPDLVLSCWLPHDSGAEGRILADPGVRWYLAVVQAGPGYAGGEALWRAGGWSHERLEAADRWSVSRADYLSGGDTGEHIRHGLAFLFTRTPGAA